MKQILLATAATIALSLPAMAQGQMQQPADQNTQQPMDQQNQMNSPSGSSQMGGGSSSGMQAQRINPSDLSRDQVTQIQQALNQKGFDIKSVDGKWGPETRSALRKFQQQNNIQGSGQLDQQTLAQLGVDFQGQGGMGSGAGTTGSGMGSGSSTTPGAGSSGMDQNQMSPSGSGTGTGTGTTSQPQ